MCVLNESILANLIKLYFLILTSNVGKRKGSQTDRCYSWTCRIWKTVEQGAKMRGQRSWSDLNFLWMYLRAHTIFLIYFIWNILLLSLAFERSAPLIKLPTRLVWECFFKTFGSNSPVHPRQHHQHSWQQEGTIKGSFVVLWANAKPKFPLCTYITNYQDHHVNSTTVHICFSLFADL